MSEHYTQATEETMLHCDTCGRMTVHAVLGGRLPYCTEHGVPRFSKKQLADKKRREAELRELQTPRLF